MTMAFTVRKIKMRRAKVKNQAGALAQLLAPVAEAGLDLEAVIGYASKKTGPVDVYCSLVDTSKKAGAAADACGFTVDEASPALLVEGDNGAGVLRKVAQAVADAGVSMRVCLALPVGSQFAALLGFDDPADADKAAKKIRAAGKA